MSRIVSLLPAATEIAAALGLMDDVVDVSHECDFPDEANMRPRVTHCQIHNAGLTSKEVDEWVRRSLQENGAIYTIDEPLLRKLRPDVILTQKLCDVCAVGYGTVARLAETLPGPRSPSENRRSRCRPCARRSGAARVIARREQMTEQPAGDQKNDTGYSAERRMQ